jgi:hypothetical protein
MNPTQMNLRRWCTDRNQRDLDNITATEMDTAVLEITRIEWEQHETKSKTKRNVNDPYLIGTVLNWPHLSQAVPPKLLGRHASIVLYMNTGIQHGGEGVLSVCP